MKILHIGCSYLPYRGGGTVRLKHLIHGYARSDTELFLATHTPSDDYHDDLPFTRVLRQTAVNGLLPSRALIGFIRETTPDIAVLHNSRILMAWMLFYRRLFPEVRIICEIHSVRERTAVHSMLNRKLYARCDHTVVLSETMHQRLSAQLPSSTRISTIYNGADTVAGAVGCGDTRRYNPSEVHYAYAGSFHDWQGVTVLAEAVRELGIDFWKRHRLTLVGGGSELGAVKKIIGSDILSQSRVRILGWRSEAAVAEIMRDVDFLLAPRRSNPATEMTVPLKVAESIKWSIPLVASRVGGLTELLGGEEPAALFVQPGSVSELARALRRGVEAAEYDRLKAALRKRVVPTWQDSADRYRAIFEGFLRSPPQGHPHV